MARTQLLNEAALTQLLISLPTPLQRFTDSTLCWLSSDGIVPYLISLHTYITALNYSDAHLPNTTICKRNIAYVDRDLTKRSPVRQRRVEFRGDE